jgi:hypothetical protein
MVDHATHQILRPCHRHSESSQVGVPSVRIVRPPYATRVHKTGLGSFFSFKYSFLQDSHGQIIPALCCQVIKARLEFQGSRKGGIKAVGLRKATRGLKVGSASASASARVSGLGNLGGGSLCLERAFRDDSVCEADDGANGDAGRGRGVGSGDGAVDVVKGQAASKGVTVVMRDDSDHNKCTLGSSDIVQL